MSIRDRILRTFNRFPVAIQLLRNGTMPAPIWMEQKAGPDLWPSWLDNRPQRQLIDYHSYAKHGYSRNSLMYAAIMYKARAISLAPLRAYIGDEENPEILPINHPLAALTRRPNHFESMMEFMQKNVIYDNVAGNIFIYKNRDGALDGLPTQLLSIRPDRVSIVPQGDSKIGFVYDPRGDGKTVFPIVAEDMIHIKRPNPEDPLEGMGYGISPMAAAAEVGDVDNMVTAFLNRFWKTGVSPMIAIEFDIPLDAEDTARYRQQITEIYGRGAEGWVRPFITDKGGKIRPLTPAFKDMDFINLDARNETRVLSVYGVPGMLVGAFSGLNRATFSNFEQATRTFWQDTMWPELMIVEVDLRDHLRTADGGFVAFDTSRVPSLQRNVPELITSYRDLFNTGVPRSIAANIVGLDMPPTSDGDVGYMPANMIPVARTGAPSESTPGAIRVEDEQQSNDLESVEHKAAVERRMKKLDAIYREDLDSYKSATKRAFENDRREVLARIDGGQKSAYRQKASVDWKAIISEVDEFFDSISWLNWQEEFAPVLLGTVEAAGEMWAAELGTAFDIRNIEAEAWFTDYKLKFAQDNIMPTTREGVHQILAQAETEGWSIPQTSSRTRLVFDQWMSGGVNAEDFEWITERLPVYRTELIARTELTRMANVGSFNLFKAWDVQGKEWVTAGDSDVRESHKAMNHQKRPIDEPFESGAGNALMYPGDPGAPIDDTANCRCGLLPDV